ncbi:hypothetical protein U1872_19980 [Sphingomonas sp. RB3P16]
MAREWPQVGDFCPSAFSPKSCLSPFSTRGRAGAIDRQKVVVY